ncbi:acyl-CoA dehydrogenase [Rhodococcus sp. NPDC059968]|uniref:acyl-CoA dehydrogenase n=1 Tax=Rhodococcus sp. NPDC059968 TaxID=3347017 RepID=UPI00366F0656
MTSTIMSRRDIDFLLFEWLDVCTLLSRERFTAHSRETFTEVLDLSEQLAEKRFAPHNRKGDLQEPRLVDGQVELIIEIEDALGAYAAAGLIGSTMDESVGGMQLPQCVFNACTAWFYGANMSTAAYNLLTVGNANLLLAHGTSEQIDAFVRPMLDGRHFGTMALSEPQAGSSLADIATRALPQPDGSYRLFGSKMWISGADHQMGENIIHLVLAKAPGGGGGVKGISLFIVPKFLIDSDGRRGARNDIVVTGLNHKMGARGTVNTILNLGDGTFCPDGEAGAVGYLVGEEHRGLQYMFHMMNEARVGIGLSATSLGYTGYLKSLEYARSRPQGRPAGRKNARTPQSPIVEHADVRRMLLAQKSYVEGALALNLFCGRVLDEQKTATDPSARERAGVLLDFLTPIAKSWPSQWCLQANSLAIQVHGGYGYTRDYDVEQHYRDNRLNPIHEGTHGIQAQDLLARKVLGDDGKGLHELGRMISLTVERASVDVQAKEMALHLNHSWERLVAVAAHLQTVNDPAARLANASVFLEVAGHVVVAWIWLEQVLAAHGKAGDFYIGKRLAAQYFFRWELPRTAAQLELLAVNDGTLLEMKPEYF